MPATTTPAACLTATPVGPLNIANAICISQVTWRQGCSSLQAKCSLLNVPYTEQNREEPSHQMQVQMSKRLIGKFLKLLPSTETQAVTGSRPYCPRKP